MARPLRIEFPGAYYHVMNRGGAGRKAFMDDVDRKSFVQLIGEASKIGSLILYAYCLLDTHYHLLLSTPEGNLSQIMRHINGVFTQRYNRRHAVDGPLFRGRFKSVLIDSDAYILEVIRYIHLNPVKAGIVKAPEDHRWTSHREYLGKKPQLKCLYKEEVLRRFSSNILHARRKFDLFVNEGIEQCH